jgi:glucose/mannose-6-phosphate isomerase
VPAAQGRQPRASLWSLSTPLLVARTSSACCRPGPRWWRRRPRRSSRSRPAAGWTPRAAQPGQAARRRAVRPAARALGDQRLAGTAAYRFACQLNENAKTPATWGALPEADHNQVVAFDGPFAGVASPQDPDDFFRDREDDEDADSRLTLVLLRDVDEHPQVARRADVSAELARERGVPLSTVQAEGASSFARLASLIGVTDWASAYLALLLGIDPTPVDSITALTSQISR